MQRKLSGDRPFRLRSETTALFLPGFPMFPRSTRAASRSLTQRRLDPAEVNVDRRLATG
jgi:hypothetical protein